MAHRAHLFSLRLAHAFRESCLHEPYSWQRFLKDSMAGVTVGIIAIPLAMALAIASGVAPQYGLYTAIIGGFVIALLGGSRLSISGPTAAFVVLLFPIAERHGLGGLLVAGLISGVILIGMALLRLGRLIEYIPNAVTLGFTAGIGIVIATLQIKDFFGLPITSLPETYVEKIVVLAQHALQFSSGDTLVAFITLGIMLLWPRLKTVVPAHLPALLVAALLTLVLTQFGYDIDTIGSRFSYTLPNGETGSGIPPFLPEFKLPWLQPGADGLAIQWNWQLVESLLPAAFAIAMLGAIESLLCAVVLDGMTGKRHSANSELLGQGIGNVLVPFFGGITATAAIARSAANFKAGATSPVAAMVHAGVVLLGLVGLAPLLAYVPMAGMAALLMMVAWNMSGAAKAKQLIQSAPKSDVLVFLVCLSLTVLFDMVVAITTGIVLASLLFMQNIAAMTRVSDISQNRKLIPELPEGWSVFKISGPLFFAAADRIFGEIAGLAEGKRGIVLYMDGVPVLDEGGLSAMNKLINTCAERGTRVMIADLQFQPLKTLARAGATPIEGVSSYHSTLSEALEELNGRAVVADS